MVGTTKCEWFKLFLEPHALRDGAIDPRLPALPVSELPLSVFPDKSLNGHYTARQKAR